jgi:hypothetical protein
MTDKPEAVAWMYHKPGYVPSYSVDRQVFPPEMGLTETPLYAHPPQPDASALVEALTVAGDYIAAKSWGADDNAENDIVKIIDAALSAWEAQHG